MSMGGNWIRDLLFPNGPFPDSQPVFYNKGRSHIVTGQLGDFCEDVLSPLAGTELGGGKHSSSWEVLTQGFCLIDVVQPMESFGPTRTSLGFQDSGPIRST